MATKKPKALTVGEGGGRVQGKYEHAHRFNGFFKASLSLKNTYTAAQDHSVDTRKLT